MTERNEPLAAGAIAEILKRHPDARVVVVLNGHAVPVTATLTVNPAMLKNGDTSPVFLALVNESEFGEYAAYGENTQSTDIAIEQYIHDRYPVKLAEVNR